MFKILLHDDAVRDLKALWASDRTAAACIAAVLEEIEGNQDLLDRLTQHDYGKSRTASFNVSKWFEFWRKGKDLWRLKIWDLEDQGLRYRIVYAYVRGRQEYRVLAIISRHAIDYDDEENPISERINRAYDEL